MEEKKQQRGSDYYVDLLNLVVAKDQVSKADFEVMVDEIDQKFNIVGTSPTTYYYIKNKLMTFSGDSWISRGRLFSIDSSKKDEIIKRITTNPRELGSGVKEEKKTVMTSLSPEDKAFRDYILKRAREYEGLVPPARPSATSIQEVKKLLGRRPTKATFKGVYRILQIASQNMGRISLSDCSDAMGWASMAVKHVEAFTETFKRFDINISYKTTEEGKSVSLDFIKISETMEKIDKLSVELYGISQKETNTIKVKGQYNKILVPKIQEESKDSDNDISSTDRFIARVALGMMSLDRGSEVYLSLADILKILRNNTYLQVFENTRDLTKILKKFNFVCSDANVFKAGNKELIFSDKEYLSFQVASVSEKTKESVKKELDAVSVFSSGDVEILEVNIPDTLHNLVKLSEIYKFGEFSSGNEKILSNPTLEERIKAQLELEKVRKFKMPNDSYKADIVLWRIEENFEL